MPLSLWHTQDRKSPALLLKVALRVPEHLVSALDVLPEMAKHLPNTASTVADALRASLGLYVCHKGTDGCGLRVTAGAFECERMVSSRLDVSRHYFICRKPPAALITAESSGAAVEGWPRLEIFTRSCTKVLSDARYDVVIGKYVFDCQFVHSNARGGAQF